MTKKELRKRAEQYVDRMPRYPFLNTVNRPAMIRLFMEAISDAQGETKNG